MADELDVIMYGYRVGGLSRLGVEDYVLEYDERWVGADESVPLSLSLPLSRRQHRGRVLADFIDNLLPDSADVRQRWATDAGLDSLEPYGLLREYGQDVAGAASFRSAGALESSSRTVVTDDEIAERIRVLREDDTAWHDDRRAASGQFSLGGAQRKFSLARHAGRWFETSGDDPSTHIVKPQVSGARDGELVEYVVMRTAALLGIPTAGVELFVHEGQHSLVVERFDRRVEGARAIRLHQEDLLQSLGQPRLRKYESSGGPGVDAISGLLAATADNDSLRRYAVMLAFSWIVLSTDAHAKNYSVFVVPEGARLTPLYDSSSLLPYLGDAGVDLESVLRRAADSDLSVRFGASYRTGDIAAFEFERIAQRCRMDADELIAIVAVLLLDVADVMSDAASGLPAELQTGTVARLVDWMPARARQAAEALGLHGLLDG